MQFQICKLLQAKSKFPIGFVKMAGSSGKKTTIQQSDFDCVLFVNGEEPVFDEVLDDFESILQMSVYPIKGIKLTRYSIQFRIDVFDFDFLPASNFVEKNGLSGDSLIDQQQRSTLDRIKHDPSKLCHRYSAGLSQAVVRFMKKQSSFVHDMVRIAKFWFKTVYIEKNISGAKTLIELVAVHAANQYQFEENNHLKGFVKFLELIRSFESLRIVFREEYKFPEHQMAQNERTPIVMDPSNPYNNFARDWMSESYSQDRMNLMQYATETLRRVNFFLDNTACQQNFLERLFVPQPLLIPEIPEELLKANFMVSSESKVRRYPELKIRNEKITKNPALILSLEMIKMHLLVIMASNKSADNVYCLRSAVQEMVSGSIRGQKLQWVPADKDIETSDATFILPCGEGGGAGLSVNFAL